MDKDYNITQYTRLVKNSYANVPLEVGNPYGHHAPRNTLFPTTCYSRNTIKK